MPYEAPPTAEVVPEMFPDQWADSPAERSKQLNRLQSWLANETAGKAPETLGEHMDLAWARSWNAAAIGSMKVSTLWIGEALADTIGGVAKQVGKWISKTIIDPLLSAAKSVFGPVAKTIGGAFSWFFSKLEAVWSFVSDITTAIYGKASEYRWRPASDIQRLIAWIWDFFQDPIGAIKDALNSFWETVSVIGESFWNTFTSTMKDVLNSALSGIWGAGQWVLGKAWKSIEEAFEWIYQRLDWTWDKLATIEDTIWNQAKGALEHVIDPLWSILEGIKRFFSKIYGSLSGIAGTIGKIPQKMWNGLTTLTDWVKQIPGKIWKGLQQLGGWIKQVPGKIWQGMKQLGGWIYEGFRSAFGWLQEKAWPWFRNTLNAIWSTVQSGVNWIAGRIMDVFHSVVHTFANFSHVVTDAVAGGFKKVLAVITKPLADFYQWTMQEMVMAPLKGLRGGGGTLPGVPAIIDTVGDIAEELYVTLREGIEYEPPATFEKAQDAAGDFLTYGLVFGGMDAIVTMAEEIWDKLRGFAGGMGTDLVNKIVGYAETVNPFQQYHPAISGSTAQHFGGIAKFFKSTYYALGLGFMMWTIWSGSLRAIMADPREEHYRRVYKTKYPEASTFKDAFAAQMTLPSSNEEWLSVAGYNPMYRDMMEQLSWERLSKSEIKDFYEKGYIKEGELWNHVKWLGYTPQVANWIVEDIKQGARKPKNDDIIEAVQDGYKEGIFDRETAEKRLKAHGMNEAVSNWYTYALDIETEIEDAQKFIKAIDEGFDEKLKDLRGALEDEEISREEFENRRRSLEDSYRHRLASYMRRPDRVEAKIMYWKNKNLPEQVPIAVKTISQRIEDMKQEIANKRKQREYMVKRRKETRETYEARMEVIKQRMSADARELRKRLENLREERKNEIARLKSERDREIQETKREPTRKIERLKEERAREVSNLENELDRKIATIKEDLSTDLQEKRADYADNVARAVQAANPELAKSVEVPWTAIVNQFQAEPDPELPQPEVSMEKIRAAVEEQAPALPDRIRTDIRAIKEDATAEIEQTKADYQAQISSTKEEYNARIEDLKETFEPEVQRIKEEYAQRIQQTKNDYDRRIERIQAEIESLEPTKTARLDRLQENMDDKLLYYDQRINRLERKIEDQQEELNALQRVAPAAS